MARVGHQKQSADGGKRSCEKISYDKSSLPFHFTTLRRNHRVFFVLYLVSSTVSSSSGTVERWELSAFYPTIEPSVVVRSPMNPMTRNKCGPFLSPPPSPLPAPVGPTQLHAAALLEPIAADAIDLTDDRWEVFYLFEEKTPREVLGEKWRPSALAGYFTAFGFRNPVKGVSLRICQALILPQFQRQGKVSYDTGVRVVWVPL